MLICKNLADKLFVFSFVSLQEIFCGKMLKQGYVQQKGQDLMKTTIWMSL